MNSSGELKHKLIKPDWLKNVRAEDKNIKKRGLHSGRSVKKEASSKRMYLPSDDKEITCYGLAERFVGVSGDDKWKKVCGNLNNVLREARADVDAKVKGVRRILDYMLSNLEEINEIPSRYLFCIMHSLTFIVRHQGEGKEAAYALIDRVIDFREAAEVNAVCKALDVLGYLMTAPDGNEAERISCFENKVDQLVTLLQKYCIPKLKGTGRYSTCCFGNLRNVVVGLSKIYSCGVNLGRQSNVQEVLDFVIDFLHTNCPPLPDNAGLLVDILGSLLICENFVYEGFNRNLSLFLKHAVADLQEEVKKPGVLDSIQDTVIIKFITVNSRGDYIYTDKFQRFMDVLVDHIAKHIDRVSVSQLKKNRKNL